MFKTHIGLLKAFELILVFIKLIITDLFRTVPIKHATTIIIMQNVPRHNQTQFLLFIRNFSKLTFLKKIKLMNKINMY
jgi:hypothetical protein